jgi:hypothetical protein
MFHLFRRLAKPGIALAVCGIGWSAEPDPAVPDPRPGRLAEFFQRNKSPLAKYADQFVSAADRYGLDWRLLPSLAMVESGGGRVYARNNVFGWASGRARFDSIPDGILAVARALAEAAHYRNKDLRGKLRTYNPARRDYADIVLRVFAQISPEPPLASALVK